MNCPIMYLFFMKSIFLKLICVFLLQVSESDETYVYLNPDYSSNLYVSTSLYQTIYKFHWSPKYWTLFDSFQYDV